MALYFAVILFSLIYGGFFYNKRNRIVGFLVAMYLAYVTASMPPFISDFATYKFEYNNQLQSMEPLYNLISKITYHVGLSYEQFRYIIAFGFFLILFWGISRLKLNSLLIITLYGIFPFFVDTIQIRILGYTAFFVLAISFFKENSILNMIITEILLIMGTGFHSVGFIFVLFPIVYWIEKRFSDKFVFFFMVSFDMFMGFFMLFFGKKWILGGGLANLISAFSGRKSLGHLITSYYVKSASFFGLIIWWAIMLFCFAIVYLIKERENYLGVKSRISGIGRSLLVITSLSIPLIVLGGTYSRVYRIGFIIISIMFVEYLVKFKDKLNIKFIVSLLFVVAISSSSYILYLGNVINQIPDILNK